MGTSQEPYLHLLTLAENAPDEISGRPPPHEYKMKFGKIIQSQQVSGWSKYYLDYKSLKKIVSSLSGSKLSPGANESSDLPPLALSPSAIDIGGTSTAEPGDLGAAEESGVPITLLSVAGNDDDRDPDFQRCKAMFFFKLERELEKINEFYLQREAELKLRLAKLLKKRKDAFQRRLLESGDGDAEIDVDGVEWRAVEEGFRLLEQDLSKLQQFIDINATGFRKILKKWDKRSKSTTKEMYLARQVEVQPCFNRQLIVELSDIVTTCLLDLGNVTTDQDFQGTLGDVAMFSQQMPVEAGVPRTTYSDFEANLTKAVLRGDEAATRNLTTGTLTSLEGRTSVARILWRAIIQAPPPLANTIIESAPFDFQFVDDINSRTCLHEAAIAGELRLVEMCLQRGIKINQTDAYGRTALHYACMNGHDAVCSKLVSVKAMLDILDKDNYSPLIHAVVSGKLACVQVLLREGGVNVEPAELAIDLNPLTLACQHGHFDIALLLLNHGAENVANTNGEYPIHLSAREGHADLCRLLVRDDTRDVPDKYHEWTPLFHAARHGHEECVQILLEAGCDPHTLDESEKLPVFYAAWHGHIGCANMLLRAMTLAGGTADQGTHGPFSVPPLSNTGGASEQDIDMIPSLSLPPPIMPFRIYGHNYLDKTYLVQVSIEYHTMRVGLASLSPLASPSLPAEPSMRLVISSKPDVTSAPQIVTLPLSEDKDMFAFQIQKLEDLSLEFSFFPSFGSKTIGRAVALPSSFEDIHSSGTRVLPVLDHRLHVIGQIAFEVCIVTPFSGAPLEIGGAIETYWKSTAIPSTPAANPAQRSPSNPHKQIASATASPMVRSPAQGPANSGVTLSSLSGDYVHVVVQVSRDLVPVVYSGWNLPVEGFDLGVADVTFKQIEDLTSRGGMRFSPVTSRSGSAADWHRAASSSIVSLQTFLEVLPLAYGISIELAFPTASVTKRHHLGHVHELNEFVDSVLGTVYNVSSSFPTGLGGNEWRRQQRKVVFSSFIPHVCTALNWKQPNYAVFFASKCGVSSKSSDTEIPLAPIEEEMWCENDRRCMSVKGAVDFARSNNLLGIILNAAILHRIPPLIQEAKESGLLLAAFGLRQHVSAVGGPHHSLPHGDAITVDAVLQGGVLSYIDHALRELA